MGFLKKYWWIFAIILLLIVLYFIFQSNIEQTALSGARSAMSGGTILK